MFLQFFMFCFLKKIIIEKNLRFWDFEIFDDFDDDFDDDDDDDHDSLGGGIVALMEQNNLNYVQNEYFNVFICSQGFQGF